MKPRRTELRTIQNGPIIAILQNCNVQRRCIGCFIASKLIDFTIVRITKVYGFLLLLCLFDCSLARYPCESILLNHMYLNYLVNFLFIYDVMKSLLLSLSIQIISIHLQMAQ